MDLLLYRNMTLSMLQPSPLHTGTDTSEHCFRSYSFTSFRSHVLGKLTTDLSVIITTPQHARLPDKAMRHGATPTPTPTHPRSSPMALVLAHTFYTTRLNNRVSPGL